MEANRHSFPVTALLEYYIVIIWLNSLTALLEYLNASRIMQIVADPALKIFVVDWKLQHDG